MARSAAARAERPPARARRAPAAKRAPAQTAAQRVTAGARTAAAKRATAPKRAARPRTRLRIVRRGGAAARPAAAGLLDRLVRGPGWIAAIGLLLAGVVFFNVSVLELNRGITRHSERASELRRTNAELRLRVARLASSERIQRAAAARGFVLPAPGEVRYLRAHPARDARLAARRMAPPSQTPALAQQPTPAGQPPAGQQPAPAQPPAAGAPAAEQAPAPQPAPAAPQPAPAQPPPAGAPVAQQPSAPAPTG